MSKRYFMVIFLVVLSHTTDIIRSQTQTDDFLSPAESLSAEVIFLSCGIGVTFGSLLATFAPFVDWSPMGALYSMGVILVLSHGACFISIMMNGFIASFLQ